MIKPITQNEIVEAVLERLGVSGQVSTLNSVESISAGLRRVGQCLCPISPRDLCNYLLESYSPLVHPNTELQDEINYVLQCLIAYGDFIEVQDVRPEVVSRKLLYPTPSGFLKMASGNVLLFGLEPDLSMLLPKFLFDRLQYIGYTRKLYCNDNENICDALEKVGLPSVSFESWLRHPRIINAAELVSHCNSQLDRTSDCGDLGEIEILDTSLSPKYYKGRWKSLHNETGRYVARRPQKYGADLWCYLQIQNGKPQKLLDLPLNTFEERGCDCAWHLQCAIDKLNNNPQQVEVINSITDGTTILKLFSPLPIWAQRRLDIVGHSIPYKGCLIAYCIPQGEFKSEIDFLMKMLWISPTIKAGV